MQAYIPGSMLNNFEHESIVGTPLLLKEGDLGPSKIESLGGVQNFLVERVDRVDSGVATFSFLYSSITFHVCVGK